MQIDFLGTNGWFDTETGNTPCVSIKTEEFDILLDAGNGIHKADRYIHGDRPVHLFLSHFHLDHIAGLHILSRFRFPKGLFIRGQPGTREILSRIVCPPYTVSFENLPYPVQISDLSEGSHSTPFPLESRYLVHSSPCFGYRFNLQGTVIAYCTDTGYCDAAVELGRDADLLITECAFRSEQEIADWPHLRPEDAVRIAKEAHAKRLALMHFDASQYQTLEERMNIREKFGNEFPDLFIACDGLRITI